MRTPIHGNSSIQENCADRKMKGWIFAPSDARDPSFLHNKTEAPTTLAGIVIFSSAVQPLNAL